jgi:hypothetical protein
VTYIATAHIVRFRITDGRSQYFHHIFFGEVGAYFLVCTDENVMLIRFPGVAQGTDSVQIHKGRIYLPAPACVQESQLVERLIWLEDSEFLLWFVLLTH